MKNVLTLAILLLTLTIACNKEDQADIDRDVILQYLASNSLTAIEHSSGLFYIIEEEGTGDHPTLDTKITFKYIGSYLDGVVFGQTTGAETASYKINELIKGWQIGMPLLKKEGKAVFLIPSGLGYGASPPSGVRPNAVLRFEVELVGF